MRNLNEHTSAIASFRIATACATVGEIDEDLNPFGDNVVRGVAFDVDDEAYATGVMFVARVVQALGWGQPDLDVVPVF